MSVTLRDYQRQWVDDLSAHMRSGSKRPLGVLPTGGGKTVCFTHMTRSAVARGKSVLICAHRRELVDQSSATLEGFDIDHGVVMRGHWRRMPNLPVQVASIQTLKNRELRRTPDLIIVDEAHRAVANSYLEIADRFPGSFLIGVTATPCRTDGRGLGDLFTSMVEGPGIAELTDRGFLVPARVYAPSTPDLKGIKKTGGDYNSKQLAERVDRPTLVGDLVQHWVDLAKGRQTVCFATSIAHSKHIVERFVAAGIPAEHIDGETGLKEREAILNRIRSGETRIVSNVGVWTEGVDVPVMSCAILARPTASLALARQMIGRVLRPYTDKEEAILLDHAGVVLEHGFPTDDVEWSLDGKAKRKARNVDDDGLSVRMCKRCFRMFYATTRECPECGHVEQPPVRQIEETDGRLVEVRPGGYRIKELSDNPTTAELQKVAEFMGYKKGWIWIQEKRIRKGLKPAIPERYRAMQDLVNRA